MKKFLKSLSTILLAVASAILYRMGGSGKFNTKARDVGCAVVASIALIILFFKTPVVERHTGAMSWAIGFHFLLLFGALTTYWKRGRDAKFYNWGFTGMGYSLAALPIALVSGWWAGFLIRTFVLTVSTAVWSQVVGDDELEERGRGFLLLITLPILLIP